MASTHLEDPARPCSSVRRLRNALGLTQDELAGALGCHRVNVSHIERGLQGLTVEQALTCVDLWRSDVDTLGGLEWLLRGSRAAA